MTAIAFKLVVALACSLLGALALQTRLLQVSERSFMLGALALQLVPAVSLFIALYVVGHLEPTSDIPSFYTPAGRAVLAGQLPFRDFSTSYAPLFSYLGAALVVLWNSGKIFAVFCIVLNAIALTWWHAAATVTASFDRASVRQCTVLYATSGHLVVQALLGTNQTWVSAGLAASTLLALRHRNAASGLAQALSACTSKLLAHLFWPVMWICAERRLLWIAAAILPTVLVYGAFLAAGAGSGLLYPLKYESDLISPGNLPYLLSGLTRWSAVHERAFYDGLALLVLGVTTLWLYRKAQALQPDRRSSLLLAGLALTGLVFMLFSKKSFTGYMLFVMYPVTLMLVRGLRSVHARAAFLFIFNALLVVEPSLWFALNGNGMALRTWLRTGSVSVVLGFTAVDVVLVACYAYLAWLSVRGVETTVAGAMTARKPNQSDTAWALV